MLKWKNKFPEKEGIYWLYGEPFMGQMGKDYFDVTEPIKPRLCLVKINSNGFLCTTEGQFMPNFKFNKKKHCEGWTGYWCIAELPEPPKDIFNLFT